MTRTRYEGTGPLMLSKTADETSMIECWVERPNGTIDPSSYRRFGNIEPENVANKTVVYRCHWVIEDGEDDMELDVVVLGPIDPDTRLLAERIN